jgi:serine/threonine protein kinase
VSDANSERTLSPEELERVDRVCDRFENAWRSGQRPELKSFVEDLETPVGKAMLRELLKVELPYRAQRGEQPTVEEYQALFPEHANLIAAVFAEAMDQGSSSEGATTPPNSSAVDPEPPPSSESRPVLEYIGRYKVVRRLGGGTYGDVYLAHDGVMDRQVAIKVPSDRLLATDRAREEFLHEARSVARLQHSGIVQAYDFGDADGRCYIVYEFVDGESLEERIKLVRLAADPLSLEEAIRIVAHVAEALHYAHLQELIHRDIKPANILLDRQGKPRVTDLGLAIREEDLAGQRGIQAGTLLYMSPEQVRREGHLVDGRTDIYSLGVVLYQLLCGRRPFEAATIEELKDLILHREAKPLRQIKDSIPAELERICLKALSKRVNERYTTAKDMAEELRRTAMDHRPPVQGSRTGAIRGDEWQKLLEVAHRGKKSLLSAPCPQIADYEFFLFHEPLNDGLGGDFYDFIRLSDSRLAMVFGDVMGRGMIAVACMAKLVHEMRSLARHEADPAGLVTALNRKLTGMRPWDVFATLLFLCLDHQKHTVSVVNAGHMPPLVRRKGSGRIIDLVDASRAGMPLGIDSDCAYEAVSVPLEPGDTVLLYTDGVSEGISVNGELFGHHRLRKAFEAAGISAAEAGEAIVKAVRAFASGSQPDDSTVIAFARKHPPEALVEAPVTLTEHAEGLSAPELGEGGFPLYVLTLGRAAEIEALRDHLSKIPDVKGICHEEGAHHAFGQIRSGRVDTIFVDPFSMWGGVEEASFLIFHVRLEFPEIAFVLFVNSDELEARQGELFSETGRRLSNLTRRERDFFTKERRRLSHYFRLSKNVSDPNFSNELTKVLAQCQQWHQTIVNQRPNRNLFEYDVALSFAGEDRRYAEEIAEILEAHGVRVFYDSFEQANLWGKNLFEHLHGVYSKKARFCIMLVSSAYASTMWTVLQRRSAQERSLKERDSEYILPVRIDDTDLPGLPSTVAHLDIRDGALHICKLFIEKLSGVLGSLS